MIIKQKSHPAAIDPFVQATFVESGLPGICYPNMVLMIQNSVGCLNIYSRYVAFFIMQTFVKMACLSSDSCVCQVQATPQDGLAKHGTGSSFVRVVICRIKFGTHFRSYRIHPVYCVLLCEHRPVSTRSLNPASDSVQLYSSLRQCTVEQQPQTLCTAPTRAAVRTAS